MKKQIYFLAMFIFFVISAYAEEHSSGRFIIAPMAGVIHNEIQFSLPNSSSRKTIKDDGPLYGLYLMYVKPNIVFGTLNHYSYLDNSTEDGHLVFFRYYFRYKQKFQPTIGCAVENISVNTELPNSEVAPLSSLDADIRVWASNPTIGISYKDSFNQGRIGYRITPFIGYFNEQVNVDISSPGMKIQGQNQFGFKAHSFEKIDYFSCGIKLSANIFRMFAFDTKLYFRLRSHEDTLYTIRNRFDLYFSKKAGLTAKIDYFQDTYDKNTFFFLGPSIIF